jgi:hypothetical protein
MTRLLKNGINVLTGAFIALACLVQLFGTNLLSQEFGSLDRYLNGDAYRPFAYRQLIPSLIRGIQAITPISLAQCLDRWGLKLEAWTGVATGSSNQYPGAIFWLALLQVVALAGYVWVGSRLYSEIFPDTKLKPYLGPLLLLILVPFLGQKLGHVYDFSVLFFMSSLILAMLEGRHGLYFCLFALACLNKETAVLSCVAYMAVFYGQLSFRNWALAIVGQIIIFVVIYASVSFIFKDNVGAGMDIWIFQFFPYWREHAARFFVLGALGMWLLYRWDEKPLFLRRTAIMILPQLGLMVLGAKPGELRNTYEILPVLSIFFLRNCELLVRPQSSSIVGNRSRSDKGGAGNIEGPSSNIGQTPKAK